MAYFTINKNLTGDKINYIARDPYGIVRLRAKTLKKLEKMIREYKRPKPEEIEEELKERAEPMLVPKLTKISAVPAETKEVPTEGRESSAKAGEKPKAQKSRKRRKIRKKRKVQGKKKAAPEVKEVASLGKLEVPPLARKEEVKPVEEIIEKEEKPKREEEETKTAPEAKKKSRRRRKRKTAQKREKTPQSKFFGYKIK